MPVEHKAKALAVLCIDYRFQEVIDQDLQSRGLNGNVDRIAWPGASKDLDNVSEAAKVSIRLHNPDLAYIYEHEDCGAYGENNSTQTHKRNAEELAQRLRQIKPTLEVNTFIATFEGIKEL